MHLPLTAILAAAVESAEAAHGAGASFLEAFGLDVGGIAMQVLSFAILAFVLYRFGIRPVIATMDERNTKIAEGLQHAEAMRAKLADAERQHAESVKKAALDAQKIIDEARASAKSLLDRETAQATEKTQQMIAKAEQAIELERKKMLADVRQEISRLVALTAQRVLSRELAPEERKRYTEAAARELTSV